MPPSDDDPSLATCENCGQLIDTSAVPPLTNIRCPDCDHRQLVNTQFHHFKLIEILGSGGMGAVYRAQDESLNRTVALKLLKTEHTSDRTLVQQFEKEAAITASINHPHVVKIFSTGMDRGTLYIVMELVDKGSLDDLMTSVGRVGEAQVLEIGSQIAQGLQAAWRTGLLHRDVKPGNMLFTDSHTAKIVDFGLAALADESGHIDGEVWGTPYYVAPEKLESPPEEDFRSDIYSLGSALFHAIAGRPPYEAEDASIVALKVLKSQAVSVQSFAPDVSNATAFVINRMLKKNPAERYQSYQELIEHLEFARRELTASESIPFAQPAPKKRSNLLPFAAATLLIGGGAYYLLTRPPSPAKVAVAPATPAPVYLAEGPEKSAEARRLLIAGELPRAIDAFKSLDRENVEPNLRGWNLLQRALAEVLAGQPADAAKTLETFTDPAAPKFSAPLTPFFREMAVAITSQTAPDPAQIATLDPATHQAFALIVAGVKHWLAGDVTTALGSFTRFQSAEPAGDDAWLADYKPFAASYAADRDATERARSAAAAAEADPTKKKAALETTHAARTALKHRGPLAEELAALETKLAADVAAQDAEMAKQMAVLDQQDAELLKGAQTQIDQRCRHLQLAEAGDLVNGLKLRGTKHIPALELLKKRIAWLSEFKTTFFDDLRKLNFRGPVFSNSNANLGTGLWQPRDTGVKVLTATGSFEAPWTNVHPQSLMNAVNSTIHAGLTPEQIAERRWGFGLFLLAWRRDAEARPQLTEAAKVRPAYQEALPHLGLAAE